VRRSSAGCKLCFKFLDAGGLHVDVKPLRRSHEALPALAHPLGPTRVALRRPRHKLPLKFHVEVPEESGPDALRASLCGAQYVADLRPEARVHVAKRGNAPSATG